MGREQGADASDLAALLVLRKGVWSYEFKLHVNPARNYGNIMPHFGVEDQPKAEASSWLQ